MNPAPSPMRPFIPENFNNTLRLFFCCDPFSTLLGEITSRYPLNSDHKRTGVARDKKENTTMKSWCTVIESRCKDRSKKGKLKGTAEPSPVKTVETTNERERTRPSLYISLFRDILILHGQCCGLWESYHSRTLARERETVIVDAKIKTRGESESD